MTKAELEQKIAELERELYGAKKALSEACVLYSRCRANNSHQYHSLRQGALDQFEYAISQAAKGIECDLLRKFRVK